jgi:hypothetical protein
VRLRIILYSLVSLTLFLAIYPEPALALLGFPNASNDLAVRLFASVNAVLLTWASGLTGRTLRLRDARALSPRFSELDSLSSEFRKLPQTICLIFDQYPSIAAKTVSIMRSTLQSACVMANLKPVFIRNFREMIDSLELEVVSCVLADIAFYEELWQECRRNRKAAFFFSSAARFAARSSTGRVELKIKPDNSIEAVSDIAAELVNSFSHDTPRGIGFRGNWMTTYGLMSIEQDRHGEVKGLYWYASGIIEGRCSVDPDRGVLRLEFNWSQASRRRKDLGSRNTGIGVFFLPAGYETFNGYWHNKGQPDTVQSWCGCRLSGDITRSIREGGSYARDFGLSQHSISKLSFP